MTFALVSFLGRKSHKTPLQLGGTALKIYDILSPSLLVALTYTNYN